MVFLKFKLQFVTFFFKKLSLRIQRLGQYKLLMSTYLKLWQGCKRFPVLTSVNVFFNERFFNQYVFCSQFWNFVVKTHDDKPSDCCNNALKGEEKKMNFTMKSCKPFKQNKCFHLSLIIMSYKCLLKNSPMIRTAQKQGPQQVTKSTSLPRIRKGRRG